MNASAKSGPETGPVPPPLIRLVARIPSRLWKRVRYHALDTGLSATRITERALEEYLAARSSSPQTSEAVKP